MGGWKIVKAWAHDPQPGSDRDYAKSFTVTDGEREVQSTVEFAAPSGAAGPKEAERVLRPFLEREEPPPRRILVSREGEVSISEGGR